MSLWYLRHLLPSRGQAHDPVPVDVTLQFGLLAEGTGDPSGKVRDIVDLQQELEEKRRDRVELSRGGAGCTGTRFLSPPLHQFSE